MTNDEAQMTNDEVRMTNEAQSSNARTFVIWISGFIRHSGFDIRI